jgi:hypothetical protein
MSQEITTARVQEFTEMVESLLQQKGSRLRSAVRERSHKGKQAVAVDQLGVVEAQEKQARHADLPTVEVPHARRWVTPTIYQFRDFIDDPDTLEMLWDPRSGYAETFAMALGRAIDNIIIAAFFATSVTGESAAGTEAFDTNDSIAVGGTGMTVDKLREAKKILMAHDVDIDNEQLYVAITAQQHDDLLNQTQAISLDYTEQAKLDNGRIRSFMGFNFIHTELLAVAAGDQQCPCWARSGMHLGMWGDIKTPIDWLPEKQAWQVAGTGMFGATRVESGKVVRIICDLP